MSDLERRIARLEASTAPPARQPGAELVRAFLDEGPPGPRLAVAAYWRTQPLPESKRGLLRALEDDLSIPAPKGP